MIRHLLRRTPLLTLLLAAAPAPAAPPETLYLRTQKVGDITYFKVAFRAPGDLVMPAIRDRDTDEGNEAKRRSLARLPSLVPQDHRTTAVYHVPPTMTNHRLTFVGKVGPGDGDLHFRLLYPTEKKLDAAEAKRSLVPQLLREDFAEVFVALDLGKAVPVARPDRKRQRRFTDPLDDLEGIWAASQARQFAVLEALSPDFAFYGFAREATSRKYSAWSPTVGKPRTPERGELEHRRLYEMSTGSAALTESLALRRLLGPSPDDRKDRTVWIDHVRGVTIGEHPWEKMMAGKKPSPEPLAALVPYDHYYLAFKSIRSFIEFGELLDEMGTNAVRAYDFHSRDHLLRQRYEKQLCLGSTGLAKTLGPALIKGVALTGSDLYVREGSDLSVIFHVNNRDLFFTAVEPFLQKARTEHGKALREERDTYKGVTVESFVTPRREVSLHRAGVGEFVVYSNSAAALRRVLDTQAGRRKSLAESLDFQYMRTVFDREDRAEDGFGFLSDAFIRQLVGPESKIKEKRRLEALTSLSLVTSGALFVGWETGKLPATHVQMLADSGLRADEIRMPEGRAAEWDGAAHLAVSDAYNTLAFATPLIELPIDKVTPREQRDYDAFRDDYMRLWRRFFDPVGFRLGFNDKQVKVETYILPLINNSEYNQLRQWTGNGTATIDVGAIAPTTLFQFFAHLSPNQWPLGQVKPALGDWLTLRWSDSPVYREMLEFWVRREFGEVSLEELRAQEARLFLQLPFTFGIKIGDDKAFDELLDLVHAFAAGGSLGPFTKTTVRHKGVQVTTLRFAADSQLARDLNRELGLENAPAEKRIKPEFTHAKIDGVWYAGFTEKAILDQIDHADTLKKSDAPKRDRPEINSSVYLAPSAAVEARSVLRGYLEWETHRRAVANTTPWHALYRAGVLAPDANEQEMRREAMRFFGYVPVSPDGARYSFDATRGEVVNARHGSLRRPRLHADLDAQSPLTVLLDQLRSVRADLRFREDGVHTTVTLDRKQAK